MSRVLALLVAVLFSVGGCGNRPPDEEQAQELPASVTAQSEWAALLRTHELTEERVEAWQAVHARMPKAPPNPGDDGSPNTLQEIVDRLEASDQAKDVLQDAGLPAREYVLTTLALLEARFVLAARRQGLIEAIPPAVNPRNVELVERYEADLEGVGPPDWGKNGKPQ